MNYTKLKKVEIVEPIHFVGIGGSGMRPLAELCVNLGVSFSGSDIKSSNFTNYLKETREKPEKSLGKLRKAWKSHEKSAADLFSTRYCTVLAG